MEKKDVGFAYLLLLTFGLVGGHHFYLGNIGTGIVYLLLSWTGLTIIFCLVELFTLNNTVKKINARL